MSSRLQKLDRTEGNFEPKQKYSGKNLEQAEKALFSKETKETQKDKKNNQKVSIKISRELKEMLDAQKQVEAVKFDYEMIEILLNRNSENYSKRDEVRYKAILGEE